jgi:hypothetical protein
MVSPSFEARIVKVIPKISSSNEGRGTQYKSATQEFSRERLKKDSG